jgi:Hint domain
VNPKNDILNCGACGSACTGSNPYCHDGVCSTPPCTTFDCPSGEGCCGAQCCGAGQLCCDVYGPVATNEPVCTSPVNGTCPGGCTACVCASPETPIATPAGDRHIAELAAGDLVYSVDHGAVVVVPILRVNRTAVHDHRVVRVTLANGAVLEISPRHPTADGRTFGDLHAGDVLDHVPVTTVELVSYGHPFTYDILPASETHTYYAGGALIGTTLAP